MPLFEIWFKDEKNLNKPHYLAGHIYAETVYSAVTKAFKDSSFIIRGLVRRMREGDLIIDKEDSLSTYIVMGGSLVKIKSIGEREYEEKIEDEKLGVLIDKDELLKNSINSQYDM